MGQAFNEDEELLGEATGETKQEVLEKLMRDHPDAEEVRIRTIRDLKEWERLRREEAARVLGAAVLKEEAQLAADVQALEHKG